MRKVDYSKFKAQFDDAVRQAPRILITSHANPDDDSIASVLSTYYYLTEVLRLSCPVEMAYEGNSQDANRYGSFLNYEKITFVDNLLDKVTPGTLVVIVDVSYFWRCLTSQLQDAQTFESISIDHHATNEGQANVLYFNAQLSSASETLFHLFYENSASLTKPVAQILLVGILGDTGNFAYVTTEGLEVFDVAKTLIRATGEPIQQLQSRYDTDSLGKIQVYQKYLSHCAIEKMSGYPDYVFSYATADDLSGFSEVDISSGKSMFTAMMRRIIGANWGFSISPDNLGSYYVSFRSIPECINVRKIAEAMPIGGGHDLAAGATIPADKASSIEEAKEMVLNYMRTHEAPRHIPAS